MGIEHKMALLTEGGTFKAERLDGTLTDLPADEVNGALGMIQREIERRRMNRDAGVPTRFGLNLLVARGSDNKQCKKAASRECSALAWAMFWEEPANESARVTKRVFLQLGRIAVDDFCEPARFRGATSSAMGELIGVDYRTFDMWFGTIYGRLQSDMSKAVYPVHQAFWKYYG